MIKSIISLFLLLSYSQSFAQHTVEWGENYKIELTDFQSPSTEIGGGSVYGILAASSIDFFIQMSNYEFMVTKNFNSKVTAKLDRTASYIMAPDEKTAYQLLSYGRLEFDLTELYARKFRNQLFENKGMFSNTSFFQPMYDQVQHELQVRNSAIGKSTDLGRNEEKLKAEHEQVMKEIAELSEYCKTCKPKKKKS